MLALYALPAGELPDRQTLLRVLRLDVGGKRAAWQRMPEEQAARSIAGVLLLQAAARAQGLRPQELRLGADAGGRPAFDGLPDVDFNLSHTAGLVVLAWEQAAGGPRVGVDAECMGTRAPSVMHRIAARWFTPAEREAFAQEPTEACFLRIWTGKEALVKWTGQGLAAARAADTCAALPGVRLRTYLLPEAVVTLCHREGSLPPAAPRFLTPADLGL